MSTHHTVNLITPAFLTFFIPNHEYNRNGSLWMSTFSWKRRWASSRAV